MSNARAAIETETKTETDAPPSPSREFIHCSVMPTTVARLYAFHSERNAFARLTPPPVFIRLLRDDRDSPTEGEVEFQLWFGPLPSHWVVRHEAGPNATSFSDRMLRGPLAYWRHEHIIEACAEGASLTDRVTFAHRPGGFWGLFTRVVFDGLPLRVLFRYRHWRTRRAVVTHA